MNKMILPVTQTSAERPYLRPIAPKSSWLWVIATTVLLFSCTEESNPDFDKQTFTAIYDHRGFSASFTPVDFRQTPDGGYLVIAERKIPDSNFPGIYILKADVFGDFAKEIVLADQYVNPVAEMIEAGNAYYFFGMDALSLQGLLFKVDEDADTVIVEPAEAVTYPAAASMDGNGFLLLSYNHVDKTSVVSVHQMDGAIFRGPKAFGIGAGDEVEEPIISHFIHTGRRFPFQVGKVSDGLYYFNGFANYTFSLVFTDLINDDPLGVVQGQQDDGGFSAVLPLGGNQFAASRFNFGENYFLPGVNLQTNGPTVGAYLGGNVLPELVPDARVKILRATVNTREVVVYASDTKSKQIGLFFYDAGTGAFIGSRYLGFSNPFEIAALIQTEDEGLAVCGTTYLAGRFPRICIFKISKEKLSAQIE